MIIHSLPELLSRRWQLSFLPDEEPTPLYKQAKLAPIYRLAQVGDRRRKQKLQQLLAFLNDRFSRIETAWPAWQRFDSAAYFDLYPDQEEYLCAVRARQDKVQVVFFTDLLVPEFHSAVHYWQTVVMPAYRQLKPIFANGIAAPGPENSALGYEFNSYILPELDNLCNKAQTAIRSGVDFLRQNGDIRFLANNAACLERLRVARKFTGSAIQPDLIERLDSIATLTVERTVNFHSQHRSKAERLVRQRYLWQQFHRAI